VRFEKALSTFMDTILPDGKARLTTNAQNEPADALPSSPAPGGSEPARPRVLLVEDHAAMAEGTAAFMQIHGLQVQVASSGRAALTIAEEFHPVLVLCDMSLPDMEGLDVAQALRARPGGHDLLIAMLTAIGPRELREIERHTTHRGVNLYLSKPLTSETLKDLLSRLEVLRRSAGPDGMLDVSDVL
jgi:CheY-like chemotaxis protein